MSENANTTKLRAAAERLRNSDAAQRRAGSTQRRHGLSRHPLYCVWSSMKQRCLSQATQAWKDYGGRGITICREWIDDFKAFKEWAVSHGWRRGLELDRINNDGPYAPDNCRFATRSQQANNTRVNVLLTAFGERKTAKLWSQDARCAVNYDALRKRLRLGWQHERAICESNRLTPTKEFIVLSQDPTTLVGRTFERDGQQREVTRIDTRHGHPDVYWKRPGGKERKLPQWWPYFREWLRGATETTK